MPSASPRVISSLNLSRQRPLSARVIAGEREGTRAKRGEGEVGGLTLIDH